MQTPFIGLIKKKMPAEQIGRHFSVRKGLKGNNKFITYPYLPVPPKAQAS